MLRKMACELGGCMHGRMVGFWLTTLYTVFQKPFAVLYLLQWRTIAAQANILHFLMDIYEAQIHTLLVYMDGYKKI